MKLLLLILTFVMSLGVRAQFDTERIMKVGRNALYFEDYVLSIQYFNTVINSKPYLYEPYFYRGLAKFHLEDYSGAEADCTAAIERNPYFPNSYQVRGLARINMNNYAAAAEDYAVAVELEPEEKSLWHNWALCYIEQKNMEKADSVLDMMIGKWSKYADGYCMKAEIKLQQNDTVTAEAIIDKAIAADPYQPK